MIITKLLDWSMIKYEKEKKCQDNGKENSIKGVKISNEEINQAS